jgi:hypothetical protein
MAPLAMPENAPCYTIVMTTMNILATAHALSDHDLLTRLDLLAGRERQASVELVAHLAALDARPSLFAAKGYSSLFAYCTEALHLSEDATANRIAAARACRHFPEILDRLASGELSLAAVRLLKRHLTSENQAGVIARALGRSKRQIEVLVAELDPQPDAPTWVRKVPAPATAPPAPAVTAAAPAAEAPASPVVAPPTPPVASPPVPPPAKRPVIQATAPERYRVQFTVGEETHDKLRRLQDLLRREIPSGDPAAIFDRALTLLLDKVEKAKWGAAEKPRPAPSIRPGADRPSAKPSRHVPRAVVREIDQRDGRQCGFVSADGHRCRERVFLEKHHVITYAEGGPATVGNMSLRCRRHNQYEAELVFGPRGGPPEGGH